MMIHKAQTYLKIYCMITFIANATKIQKKMLQLKAAPIKNRCVSVSGQNNRFT